MASSKFNIRLVLKSLGALLLIEAAFMLVPWRVANYFGEADAMAFLLSAAITGCVGVCFVLAGWRAPETIGRRESYLIVASVWVVLSAFGMIPFYLSSFIPDITNAFFETMAGFTTTGSTILTDIEALPHGLLLWRSITQWLGGMGIIVLSLAILPMFGLGSMQLYTAEVTGPTYEKLRPRIVDTAKILWGIYVLLTAVLFCILWLCDMSWFDAICHAMTTIASGGFSTKNASIAAFNSPLIEYVLCIFMILTGINYSLLYYLLFKGRISRLYHDEETRYYIGSILLFTVVILAGLLIQGVLRHEHIHFHEMFRKSLFQVSALISSTGFATSDYVSWMPAMTILCLLLLLPGGSAGSTSGGMKWIRLVILLKNARYEFRRLIHPNAVLPVKVNGRMIGTDVVNNVFAFVTIYVGIVCTGTFLFSLFGVDFEQSIGAAVTAMSNIGPGLGASGPTGNYAHFPEAAKWYMTLLMLIGRLEIFTVLFLFSPNFWKK